MKARKIGIISDIHGNDLAFKEVLKRLNGNVDEIICLGDLIGIGPNGNEVLNIASSLKNFRTVLGNHERYYLYGFNNPLSCTNKDHQTWIKNSIDDKHYEFIKNIPVEIEILHNDKKILFLHYSRRNFEALNLEYIEKDVCYEKINDLFMKYNADIIFYGHEHIASILEGDRIFINPGSLGCPHPNKDMARYGILELNEEIKYTQFEFEYDSVCVVRDMYEKNMPNKDFISSNFYKIKMDEFDI